MSDSQLLEPKSRIGTPTWEISRLFPEQGGWSEAEYLGLFTRQLIEFTDGVLEFLPMPTRMHQQLAQWFFMRLHGFVVGRKLGEVYLAPLRVKMRRLKKGQRLKKGRLKKGQVHFDIRKLETTPCHERFAS